MAGVAASLGGWVLNVAHTSIAYSAIINYAWGDTPDQSREASPDQSELDVTLDYKPGRGR